MKINRFETVFGRCVENIAGQFRIGYSVSDITEFCDMEGYLKAGGYQGAIISFYDYDTGRIYEPFLKKRNALYGKPVYLKDCFWFLQGDYNNGKITLFRYVPGKELELITQMDLEDVDQYDLKIIGEDIHIISDDDEFVCYYPDFFKFSKGSNESAAVISDGKVYFSAWIEEGWDYENDCETDEYKYYEEVVVRDFNGNVLSEEVGCLQQHSDGTWWIA